MPRKKPGPSLCPTPAHTRVARAQGVWQTSRPSVLCCVTDGTVQGARAQATPQHLTSVPWFTDVCLSQQLYALF